MRAMLLEAQGKPLVLSTLNIPEPADDQLLVRVLACGVCRTDLHVLDGDLRQPNLPLVLGHQIVGVVEKIGSSVTEFVIGDRVGVPWLGGSCGHCRYCLSERENLCDEARYTGYQVNGGFAEYCLADRCFCFPIPENYSDIQAAPLLCAGLIGYRAYRMIGSGNNLGFYGFGSAAHILIQLARYEGKNVYVFTRPQDLQAQEFARRLGAVWAGGSDADSPDCLDNAIIFASVGELVPHALRNLSKGGSVICAGIHMSDIPTFSYDLLWGERIVRSVANLTRKDGEEFLKIAPQVPIHTEVHVYPLEKANEALTDLRSGAFTGSAVVVP